MAERLVCVFVGYLCGCVLCSDMVAKRICGKSAFELGDGNPGMANVGHELGTGAALLSLAGDILKTLAAVMACRVAFPELGLSATAWAGFGATVGHMFPFWHGFKGGKGVTTIASTIILMVPVWGIAAGVVGVLAIIVTGYLSAAAVIAMAFYTAAMLVLGNLEPAAVSVLFMLLTVYAHWSKLIGIKNGTTRRAGLAEKFRRKK